MVQTAAQYKFIYDALLLYMDIYQISISTVLVEIIEALGDKNPNIRQETTNYLTRLFQRSNAASLPNTVMQTLGPAIKKLLDDTVGTVRDASALCLGICTKVVGEEFMATYIDDLDSITKQKVMNYFTSAEVKYPFGGAPKAESPP